MLLIICAWRMGASVLKLIIINSTWDCTTFHNYFQFKKMIFKIFKSWQVCNWLAKWLIMLGFMDLMFCLNCDTYFSVKRGLAMSNLALVYSLKTIFYFSRFRYTNNEVTKDRCPIPMGMTIVFGFNKFSLEPTVDYHGPSMYSGHYTTSINCCKNIRLQRQPNYGVWEDWYHNLLDCLCSSDA